MSMRISPLHPFKRISIGSFYRIYFEEYSYEVILQGTLFTNMDHLELHINMSIEV